jgi:5-bromo-4-chloroindolyl phosphate hydrolysis protein
MESNWQTIALFLLGVVQALFFWDKQRSAEEIKVLRETIKETRESIQRMERILTSLESQLAVANYALFKERKTGDSDEK